MNNINKQITHILESRILLLDGGMGALLQKKNLCEDDFRADIFRDMPKSLKGNYDLLTITRPELIKSVHREYLRAGSDIIETCSFNSNKFSQSDYDTQDYVYQLNFNAAKIAKECCDEFSTAEKPRFTAGSIGPTNQAAGIASNTSNPGYRKYSFNDFVDAYYDQIRGLCEGGADILLIETVFDPINCKAALYAANMYFEEIKTSIPIFVSMTVDANGRLLNGQTLKAFYYSIADILNILAVGLNCSLGAKQMRPYIKELAEISEFYTLIYPNAGLPNEFGEYDETPDKMAELMEDFANDGFFNLLGGCCGTTPDHIAAFSFIADKYKPRKIIKQAEHLILSGYETLEITKESNFINIGERTNAAGSKQFLKTILNSDYESAAKTALQQIENGANIIDINVDESMLDGVQVMKDFLNYIMSEHNIAKAPIMLDSSNWDTLLSGLKCLAGKGIVNSISLKDGEIEFLKKAKQIRMFGAAVIVMAFDEEGQAADLERKVQILSRAYQILTLKAGFKPHNIIFDPNILAVGTGIDEHNEYAINYLNSIKRLKSLYPNTLISGGVSNLSFSFRGNDYLREAIHTVFLFHAVSQGMDMGIVNAGKLMIYDNIDAELKENIEDLIFNRKANAEESLIELGKKYIGIKQTDEIESKLWRNTNSVERVKYALINGILDYLEEDTDSARHEYDDALKLIEGPFMDAMNTVGVLFGSGKMFLPQVVKSARAMKKAVSFLEPYIIKSKDTKSKAKILMATVKGDVHDIGKNIVSLVLACNGFEIVDIGIMASDDKIISEALKINADAIGLSGLITPSLEEMCKTAREMERHNLTIPLLIGGAATSKLHTAVKIAPLYAGNVIHGADASQSAAMANSLFNIETKHIYAADIKGQYDKIRNDYNAKQKIKSLITLENARANKTKIDYSIEIKPKKTGVKTYTDYPISILRKYIDWTQFFLAWELKGSYPRILNDPKYGKEARKVFDDAQIMLDQIEQNKLLSANAVFFIYPANSKTDDIEVYSDTQRSETLAVFHCLRQQVLKDGGSNMCLADLVAPIETNKIDYIGGFAVTAGIGIEKAEKQFKDAGDDYSYILLRIMADRLAEAFAENAHEMIRKELWGYETNEKSSLEDMLKEKFDGIRPAIGYPSLPDHSEKLILFDLLKAEENAGISLTENYMMMPAASVSGLYFARKESRYFILGKIGHDQLLDYANRKKISLEEAQYLLSENYIGKS